MESRSTSNNATSSNNGGGDDADNEDMVDAVLSSKIFQCLRWVAGPLIVYSIHHCFVLVVNHRH